MRKPPVALRSKFKRKRSLWSRILFGVAALVVGFYALCVAALLGLKWIDPPITMVQIQRRVQAAIHRRPYHKRYVFVPLRRISKDLQHAVIASEDERFYQHHGIDWTELDRVVDRDLDRGKLGRGASTITQQLVKNLFLTTSRSVARKAVEFTITPVADLILGKQRVLELYLNVIEWGRASMARRRLRVTTTGSRRRGSAAKNPRAWRPSSHRRSRASPRAWNN